jgi:Domain of unknown function (DUF6458)
MGFGVGLILTAVGAILAWAVTSSPNGVNVHAVGYILLVIGIIGMLVSLVFWSSWAGPGYFYGRRGYADDGVAPVRRRRRVIDEDVV